MKNFLNTVRNSGPIKTRELVLVDHTMVDAYGNLTLWALMDHMNGVKKKRLEALQLNEQWKEKVVNIDMKMYNAATLNDQLAIESCFVQNGKKTVDLKVYVSRQKKGQPAKRVCKTIYTVAIHMAR